MQDGDIGVGDPGRRWWRPRCGRPPAAPGSNRRRRSRADWSRWCRFDRRSRPIPSCARRAGGSSAKIAEQLDRAARLGALGDDARGIDVDHGRRGARHRVGEALHDDGGGVYRRARGALRREPPALRRAARASTRPQKCAARPTITALIKKLDEDARVLQLISLLSRAGNRLSVYNALRNILWETLRPQGFA
jgi:hypothetical protein